MNPNSTESSGVVGEPDPDSDPFLRFIEERYGEWAGEFGEDVHLRRTTPADTK
jgi:hypothetical protein